MLRGFPNINANCHLPFLLLSCHLKSHTSVAAFMKHYAKQPADHSKCLSFTKTKTCTVFLLSYRKTHVEIRENEKCCVNSSHR